MTPIDAIILGVVEGLTEFFPISSTGHLIVVERVLGLNEPSLFFNTVIQLGAILAAVIYLRKSLIHLIKNLTSPSKRNYTLMYVVATLPVLGVGFIFHSLIESFQHNAFIVAMTTILIALLMLWMQNMHKRTLHQGKDIESLGWKSFLKIGFFQAISVIPGVSRSGITVLGGLNEHLSFKDATETAFILAIPAMSAAAGFELLRLVKNGVDLSSSLIQNTVLGFVVSFFVALATISITLPIFKRFGFMPFIAYRIIMGIVLLVVLLNA